MRAPYYSSRLGDQPVREKRERLMQEATLVDLVSVFQSTKPAMM